MFRLSRKTPDDPDPAEALLREVGARLREVRMERGEELEDVAQYLRIRPTYLYGLEQGDLSVVPGRAYALGFLRSYAQYLGFDGEALIAQIRSSVSDLTGKTRLQVRSPLPESRLPKTPILVLSLAALAGIYVGWSYAEHSGDALVDLVAEVPEELQPERDAQPELARVPSGQTAAPQAEPAQAPPVPESDQVAEAVAVAAMGPDLPAGPRELTPAAPPGEAAPAAEVAAAPLAGSLEPTPQATPAEASAPAGPAAEVAVALPATEPARSAAVQPPAGPAAEAAAELAAGPLAEPEAGSGPAEPVTPPATPGAAGRPDAAGPDLPPAAEILARLEPVAGAAAPAIYGDAAGEPRVILRARSSSWLQVSSAAGDYLWVDTLEPGEAFVVPDRPDLVLWTGNAGGLQVIVDGTPLAPLGPEARVVRDVPLRPEALLQRLAPAAGPGDL